MKAEAKFFSQGFLPKAKKKLLGGEKKKKMNSKRGFRGIGIVLVLTVLVLAAFTVPAGAYYLPHGFPMLPAEGYDPTYGNGTWINGTYNGDVYFDGGHGLENTPYEQTFTLPENVDIVFAHIYMYVWGGTRDNRGWEETNFTNATGTTSLGRLWINGTEDTNTEVWGSSCGAWVVWHDVTDLVTPGENIAVVNTGTQSGYGFDGRVDNLHMIAVYTNETMDARRIWVVQGHEALCHQYEDWPAYDYGIAYFNGAITPGDWSTAFFYTSFEAGDTGKGDTLHFNDNLLCTDCADGSFCDLEVYNVSQYLSASGQHVDWWRDGDHYQHDINAVLVLGPPPMPDLTVERIDDPVLANHDYTLGVVANHAYTINATIKNSAPATAIASSATLHANGAFIQTKSVPSLEYGDTAEIQFTWTPTSGGSYTLSVTADSGGVVEEKYENNNVSTKGIEVFAGVQADLDMTLDGYDCLKLLPAYALHTANNDTKIEVKVMNNGTVDATNFDVRLFVDDVQKDNTVMTVSAKAGKLTSFIYTAAEGGPYSVKVVLDADGEVSESDEYNNETTEPLTVVTVRVRDSHHFGNTSTYNGILSNYQDVEMFDVVKLVPENCSAWDVVNSVADVLEHPNMPPGSYYTYGIDGLDEEASCDEEGGSMYWYQYVNGIYLPLNQRSANYKVHANDTMHWDIHTWVQAQTNAYNPRTVMAYNALYPEPMTHGYYDVFSDEVMIWDTTIVYPAESSEYLDIAHKIKDKLNDSVPDARISIETDTSVTSDQENTTNLILIGEHDKNDLIAEINPYHQWFAMVVHFTGGQIRDDSDDSSYNHGEVVQQCDNPYDNQPLGSEDSHADEGPVIYMASGVDDAGAKEAANLLINRTDELDSFWVVQPERSFSEELKTGANLISQPLVQDDNSVSSVLSSIDGNYSVVYRQNLVTKAWERYVSPTYPLNDFDTMDPGRGYDVRVTGNCTWIAEATTCPTMNIQLFTGANLVGWPSMNTMNVADALTSIAGNYSVVYRQNLVTKAWERYVSPTYPLNDFDTMDPGRGYDVRVTENCTWTAPPDC